jgi:DNA-binding response OmpR family regulator
VPEARRDEASRLQVDRAGREISWCGRSLPLSAREFDLLALLAADTGRVWTFAALTEQVWRRPYLGDDESVVSAVKRLRRRLSTVTADLRIASVRGIGYRLATGGA